MIMQEHAANCERVAAVLKAAGVSVDLDAYDDEGKDDVVAALLLTGVVVSDVRGDGNCFFHAFREVMLAHNIAIPEVRAVTCLLHGAGCVMHGLFPHGGCVLVRELEGHASG